MFVIHGSLFSPSQKMKKWTHPFQLCFELAMDLDGFHLKDKYSAPRTIEKMKILWAVLELPAYPAHLPQNWAKLAMLFSRYVSPKRLPGFWDPCPRIFVMLMLMSTIKKSHKNSYIYYKLSFLLYDYFHLSIKATFTNRFLLMI